MNLIKKELKFVVTEHGAKQSSLGFDVINVFAMIANNQGEVISVYAIADGAFLHLRHREDIYEDFFAFYEIKQA